MKNEKGIEPKTNNLIDKYSIKQHKYGTTTEKANQKFN